MKRVLILIMVFCFILACDRYPDPKVEAMRDYSFSFNVNQGIRFFAGEWVSNSIRFMVHNNNNPLDHGVKVVFEVVKGGGDVTMSVCSTDMSGYTFTGWKLGSAAFEQILRASTYDQAGNFLNASDLRVFGFRTDEWDILPDAPESDITSMAADTVNKITFMTTHNGLFKQGDRYYIWEQVTDPKISYPLNINIDKKGIFWINTLMGELLKSTDHGQTWISCTRPYPDYPYSYYLQLSNDDYLWVSANNLPTRYSKDSGQTWSDAGNGLSNNFPQDIFRLKDGSLLIHGSGCCSLYRSFDDGLTLNKIDTPAPSVKVFVNEVDEIFLVVQSGGRVFYKSTDYGATFSYVYGAPTGVGGANDNTFTKWGDFYFIMVPGYGILKSTDLTHYDIYCINTNMGDLFVDHNGVLIATYFNWQYPNHREAFYRKNSK